MTSEGFRGGNLQRVVVEPAIRDETNDGEFQEEWRRFKGINRRPVLLSNLPSRSGLLRPLALHGCHAIVFMYMDP